MVCVATMPRGPGCAVFLAVLLLALWSLPALAEDPVDFVRDVKPLLAQRCTACHGAEEQKSGLRLDAGALVHRGGDQGAGLVPGKSVESLLIKAVSGGGDIRACRSMKSR